MDYLVEENKLLEGPVELPRPKEGEDKLPDVFFRPPRGINRTPVEDPNFTPLYTYRKNRPDGLFEAVLVYVSTKDPQEFWTEALRPFAGVGPSDVAPDPNPPQPLDGKAIPYETVMGRGAHEHCSIYGYHTTWVAGGEEERGPRGDRLLPGGRPSRGRCGAEGEAL